MNCRPFLSIALLYAASSTFPACAAITSYKTSDGRCAGVQQVKVPMAAGFCLGLAAQHLGAPRGVLPLADGRVLVADMGRWDAQTGRLLVLTPRPGGFEVGVLRKGLDRPHGLQLGPDGRVYVGEASRISRFDPGRPDAPLEPVIDHLPSDGRHPLKNFVFGQDGSIYVNVGASTDHCEGAASVASGPRPVCIDAESDKPVAAVWRYRLKDGRWTGEVFARGLRNSTALAIDPRNGRLWQAENSRDVMPAPVGYSEALPHDELNLVVQGAHYGWPYCTDNGVPDTTFGTVDCASYRAPIRLLPPHSAPLGLAFHDNPKASPDQRRMLVVALHGYRSTGHRIIAFPLDQADMPRLAPVTLMDGSARGDTQPLAVPTDIKVDGRGQIWFAEDHNGTVLVIAPARR